MHIQQKKYSHELYLSWQAATWMDTWLILSLFTVLLGMSKWISKNRAKCFQDSLLQEGYSANKTWKISPTLNTIHHFSKGLAHWGIQVDLYITIIIGTHILYKCSLNYYLCLKKCFMGLLSVVFIWKNTLLFHVL